MSDDASPQSPALPLSEIQDDHVRRFERRANRYIMSSAAVIAVVFGLLAAVAYIFFYAQDISRTITKFDLVRQIDAARGAQVEIVDLQKKARDGFMEQWQIGMRSATELSDVFGNYHRARIQLDLLTEKRRLITDVGYPSDLDTNRTKEEFEIVLKGLSEQDEDFGALLDLARQGVESGILSSTDLTMIELAAKTVQREIEITKQRIASAKGAKEMREASGDVDMINLISTNLVRFGGVSVALFLISILIPIYRYNTRLAAFYLARADALILCRDAHAPDFAAAVAALTPQHAFEKEPRTPVEAVASTTASALQTAVRR